MPQPIARPDFSSLFQSFQQEAFRLETLDQYLVPQEEQELSRFFSGEPLPERKNKQWCELIRKNIDRGARMRRVHVLNLPLSPYLKFEIEWGYVFSLAAGEEILIVDRKNLPPQLPDEAAHDFWLFDDRVLVWMRYDEEGRIVALEQDEDPVVISRCRSVKQTLLPIAVPLRDFLRNERVK